MKFFNKLKVVSCLLLATIFVACCSDDSTKPRKYEYDIKLHNVSDVDLNWCQGKQRFS